VQRPGWTPRPFAAARGRLPRQGTLQLFTAPERQHHGEVDLAAFEIGADEGAIIKI